MAKKPNNVIALETDKYEAKVKEFQDYLEQNPIITKVEKDGEINEAEDEQNARHKEITIQCKIMDYLPNWLVALKNLRIEEEEKQVKLRGGGEMNDMAKAMINKNE